MATPNIVYSQWLGKCEFGTFCPALGFVSADTDAARKPPLAIHADVVRHAGEPELRPKYDNKN